MLIRRTLANNQLRNICTKRFLSLSSKLKTAYDSEGKTTINILNQDSDANLMINGFSQVGFRLNNNVTILGPMAIFPRSVLSWNVKELNDITQESLSLFMILEPKLDLIIIGTGDKIDDLNFHKRIYPIIKAKRFNVEILPTESACATFNFLNAEGRYIAAALLPPRQIQATDDDILRSKLRYQNLYERE